MIFLFSIRHQTDSQTASDKGKREKKCSLLSTTHLSKQQEDDSDLLAAQKKGASPHLLPSGPLPLQSDAVSVRFSVAPGCKVRQVNMLYRGQLCLNIFGFPLFLILFSGNSHRKSQNPGLSETTPIPGSTNNPDSAGLKTNIERVENRGEISPPTIDKSPLLRASRGQIPSVHHLQRRGRTLIWPTYRLIFPSRFTSPPQKPSGPHLFPGI